MSNLAKQVFAKDLHVRKHISEYEPLKIDSSVIPDRPKFANKYRLGLQLQYEALIPEGDKEALDRAMLQAKKSVVEYVFGEFREPISKLRWALFNMNYDEAIKLADKLEYSLFSTE